MKKNKRRFHDGIWGLVILICAAAVFSCGGGGGGGDSAAPAPAPAPAPATISGKVVLGPVNGAIVFADHLTGPEANYKLDASEAATATTTAVNGTFTLPVTPGYDYVFVSFGGTDTLSGQPAPCMLAPAGAKIISSLTTMVAEDPGAAAAIASLGVSYTADITQQVTPAALLLLQSVQAIVDSLIDALDPTHTKLQTAQINAIQREVMAKVAAEIKTKTAAQMTDTAALTAMLQAALKNMLDSLVADPAHSNITIPSTQILAQAVATANLINTVAVAISPAKTFSTSSSDAVPEDSLLSQAEANEIEAEKDRTSTGAQDDVSCVPKPNQPVTISGTPATQVLVGSEYRFEPTVGNADGDALIFRIVNKPSWATFNAADGELEGKPAAGDVGTTSGIVITVTDGISTVSLPAFSITVATPTGSTGGSGGTL